MSENELLSGPMEQTNQWLQYQNRRNKALPAYNKQYGEFYFSDANKSIWNK